MDKQPTANQKQRRAALNELARIQFYESRKQLRQEAIRAQFIQQEEITG